MDNIEYRNIQTITDNCKIKSFFDNIPVWLWIVLGGYLLLNIDNEKKRKK